MSSLVPVRVTAPAALPITLAEAKAHCRVSHSDDDTLISALIAAAVSHVDGRGGILGRCLIDQTWRQDFPGWPDDDRIRLPFSNVSSITSVVYFDASGTQQTLSASLYWLQADALSSYLWLREAFPIPNLDDDRPDPVRVTFVAGYGDAAAVPPAIKAALLLLIGHLYENREASLVGQIQVEQLPLGFRALIDPYRQVGL